MPRSRTGRPGVRSARAALPYLLSLPALLVCIGILIPFVTAVYYSLQRYNLAIPFTRGFIWFENYVDFLTDPAFWNTIRVSLLYTLLTVGVELRAGPRHRHAAAAAHRRQQRHERRCSCCR